jgi:hypothetical protein
MIFRSAGLVSVVSVALAAPVWAQAPATPAMRPGVVLVELFTSEGCSDCPPADELLRQMTGKKTAQGQMIIGISEHVTYWNHDGWTDQFSADLFTDRQSDYGRHLGIDNVYTPQMVVNGREQFVGGNHTALLAAFKAEAGLHQINLAIDTVQVTDKGITFTYSASDLPPKIALRLLAMVVDDTDQSNVLKGENRGKELQHAWVARSVTQVGKLSAREQQPVTVPLPASYASDPGKPRHLVLIAQQGSAGTVLGADAKALGASAGSQAGTAANR